MLLKPNIDGALQIISTSDSSTHKHRQFKEFQSVLEDCLKLVQEVDNLHIFDIYRKWLYGRKIQEFQEKIKDLIDIQGSPILAHDLQKLDADVRDLRRRFEAATISEQSISYTSHEIPDMPNIVVGMDNRINDVKQILLQNDVYVVRIEGIGGSGKNTLASSLCKDIDVKGNISFFFQFVL